MTESFSEHLFRCMVDSPAYTLEGDCHVSVGPDGKSTTDYHFRVYPNKEFEDDLLSPPADSAWLASQSSFRKEACLDQTKKCNGKSCCCEEKPEAPKKPAAPKKSEAPKKPCAENTEIPMGAQSLRELLNVLQGARAKEDDKEDTEPSFSFTAYAINGEDDEKEDSDSADISFKPLKDEQFDSFMRDFIKHFPKNNK